MNQQAILQSNLLDIIFENRNKDYGAYKLRKTYSGRLSIALLSTAALALVLSLFFLYGTSPAVVNKLHRPAFIPGTKTTNPYLQPKAPNKKMEAHLPSSKNISKKAIDVNRPPVIVAANNINSLPATPPEFQPSSTGTEIPGDSPEFNAGGADKFGQNGQVTITTAPGTDKLTPVTVAERMPQYPGGMQALLSFLKKNIHAPADVAQGEDVSVKIEFVVNYDGTLENFSIVKSGGEIFDNEVLRVLKKMPLWIPGKSKGKNVAVYYSVPVKFTGEF